MSSLESDPNFAVAAWFQLANEDRFNFGNTKKRDVVIRTTDNTQRILIGPTPVQTENPELIQPSTLTISSNNLLVSGNITLNNGIIDGLNGQALDINGVSFSNRNIDLQNITVQDTAHFRNLIKASEIKVMGETIITSEGKLTDFALNTHSITDQKIMRNTLTEDALKLGTITSKSIADRSVLGSKIKKGTITDKELAPESVTSDKYVNYSIENVFVNDEAIDTRTLKDECVTTNKLYARAVTSEKLAKSLTLEGDTFLNGPLSVNTYLPFVEEGEINGEIPPKDNNTTLDLYEKISIIGKDRKRSYLYSENSQLALNHENPKYTLDIEGSVNCTTGLFQNGDPLLFTQWFSTPNLFSNCNLCYDKGFVGINEISPSSELHTNGDIKLNSNLIFKNSDSDNAAYISNHQSNIGIGTNNAVCTLDTNGNFGIRNVEVLTGQREIHNIETLSVHENIVISKREDDHQVANAKSDNISLDVNGNVRYQADTFMINPYHMVISSKGETRKNGPLYFRLAQVKSPIDSRNNGPLIITGYLGEKNFDRSASFHISIANRGFPSSKDLKDVSVTQIYGGTPFEVSKFTDIVMYEDTSNNRDLYVFLKTTFNSSFHIEIKTSDMVEQLNPLWKETESVTRPEDQQNELKFIKSLIHDPDAIVSSYGGKLEIGNELEVNKDAHFRASFCNEGNIVTHGQVIRAISNNRDRSMFEINRHDDNASVSISTNAYKRNDASWYVYDGEQGSLQMMMVNASKTNPDDGAFHFRGKNTILDEDNVAITLPYWVTIKNGSLGINGITDPKASLHVNGNALFENGLLQMRGTSSNLDSSHRNFMELYDPQIQNGDSRGITWGAGKGEEDNSSSSTATSTAASLQYLHNTTKEECKAFFGFIDNPDILTLKHDKKIGFNVDDPAGDFHFRGNILAEDSFVTQYAENKRFTKISNIMRTYTNFSSFNNKWEKIAMFKPSSNVNKSSNKGNIEVRGILSTEDNDNSFRALISFDINNTDQNKSCLEINKKGGNLFSKDFDIAGYADEHGNFHVYLKCNAGQLFVNASVTIIQTIGTGIDTFMYETDKKIIFEDVGFSKDFTEEFIKDKDDAISGSIVFRLNVSHNATVIMSDFESNMTIGASMEDDTIEHKLSVEGDVKCSHLFLSEGNIGTKNQKSISFNGTPLVTSNGSFITDNIPDMSITYDKLRESTLENLWINTLSNLENNQIDIKNGEIGIFVDNDTVQQQSRGNPFELGSRLTLSSNVDLNILGIGVGKEYGSVHLTTSASNGLGINVPVPKFPLDVEGNVNLTGDIYKNGEIWRPNNLRNVGSIFATPSNVMIGQNLFDDATHESTSNDPFTIDETLCVQSSMSLSNFTGKTVLSMRRGSLGIDEISPNSNVKLDVGGGIALKNVEFIDEDRNLLNINRIKTPVIHATLSNLGISRLTDYEPSHLLDVNGDLNLTGNLLFNGERFNSYLNQWTGSNQGISYDKHVGIMTDIPSKETLSVKNSWSLSNDHGKCIQSLRNDGKSVHLDKITRFPSIGLSDNYSEDFLKGLSEQQNEGTIKSHSSNIGIGFDLQDDFNKPSCVLDVRGNIGIDGTQLLNDRFVMSNVSELYTPSITVLQDKIGINTRSPKHELSINGSIGFDRENIILNVEDNFLKVSGDGITASNITIRSIPQRDGINIHSVHDVPENKLVSNSGLSDPSSLAISGKHASTKLVSEEKDASCYHAFYDAQSNFGFIGLDGKGLYDENEAGTMTLGSKEDFRVVTNNDECLRILKNTNVGVSTSYPMFSLDVAGSGIGLAGEHFVDIERNVKARSINVESQLQMKNLKPNVLSVHDFTELNLKLTGSMGGLRTTDKNFGDFNTFSNIVNEEDRGTVVLMGGSNLYFSATDNEGGNSYLNFAYQAVHKNTSLAGNSNIVVDAYLLDDAKTNNIIGNTSVVGNTVDLINPRGHTGTTNLRIRNWNPHKIDSSASNISKDFFELRMMNDMDSENIVSSLHSDHDIKVMIDNAPLIEFSRNADTNVLIPQARSFGLSRLSSGGVKQVYADNLGNLTANFSDARMKKNIAAMENETLKKVVQLKPIYFDWTDDFIHPVTGKKIDVTSMRGSQREVGLIAQDVKTILPECVGNDEDNILHIDYGKIVPVLIKSIQELFEENQKLHRKIDHIFCSSISSYS